jgi:hypothetical protein
MPYADDFVLEVVYRDMDAKGGTADAVARILWKRLKPIPLSPHKTNINATPQLVATIKSLNFASNRDKTYAGCTKGITIFTVPWHMANTIDGDWPKTNTLRWPCSSLLQSASTSQAPRSSFGHPSGDESGSSTATATYWK